ncbi:MAG TPA: hypothetical protein EYN26_00700 [Chromatiales bacterium]|nr:hypothetical protein [Chromatiales bacterium]
MIVKPLSEHGGVSVGPTRDESLMSLDTDELIKLYKQAGAIYFEGFDADVETFQAFSDQFSTDYMDNRGSGSFREGVKGSNDGTIQNVGYVYGVEQQRTFPLPLHADRSYVKSQPEMMWFMAQKPCTCGGGQTIVSDGVAIWKAFSDHTRQAFEAAQLEYIRHYPVGEWEVLFHTKDRAEVGAYCKENDLIITFRDDGSASTSYFKHAMVTPKYADEIAFVNSIMIQQWQEDGLNRDGAVIRMNGERIPDDVLEDMNDASARVTIDLNWNKGDFVMVDNTRMMHGRRAFEDTEREVFVRMCRSVDW